MLSLEFETGALVSGHSVCDGRCIVQRPRIDKIKLGKANIYQ